MDLNNTILFFFEKYAKRKEKTSSTFFSQEIAPIPRVLNLGR